jgi:methylglutaconyl-CoA hydratase
MKFKTITVDESAGIALLTLNRPEKRNAISYELIADLQQALDLLTKSASQVLIITGAGKAFCAGMDLENLKALLGKSPQENIEDSRTMARLFLSIYDFPKPTIAAVNGAAIAGGTGIATVCDFTLAVPDAKFGYTEVRIGFVPAIVSNFLVRQVGEKRARDLLLSARIFGADEAFRLGLVNEIVDPTALLPRAHELARSLMESSPASLRATKELLSQSTNEELDRRMQAAIEGNARVRQTHDFREGITAFLEKRKPRWKTSE